MTMGTYDPSIPYEEASRLHDLAAFVLRLLRVAKEMMPHVGLHALARAPALKARDGGSKVACLAYSCSDESYISCVVVVHVIGTP